MAQRDDSGAALLRTEGATQTYGNGHWQHPWYIRNIECPDVKRRTAYLGTDADTFFSWPARVKMMGRWVKGFVSGPDYDSVEPRFTAQHNGHRDGDQPETCTACWLAAQLA